MNRFTRRLGAAAQRKGLIAPRPDADYFAPPALVADAKAAARARGLSDDVALACVRIAQVKTRRPTLSDVIALLDERAT